MFELIVLVLVTGFLSYIVWIFYQANRPMDVYHQDRSKKIEHDWKLCLVSHDENNHKEYKMFRCEACGKYKREYTGNVYQKKDNGIPDHDCHNIPATGEGHCDVCSKYYSANKCNFCDSTETTKYPAEGKGDVYLCEDCHSRSND